jgi:hypothetical protein
MGRTAPESTFVVFEAPPSVPRIENQAGLFSTYISFADEHLITDHIHVITAAEQARGVSLLSKIEIPAASVDSLRAELEHSGIDKYRLFPDLFGLGLYLTDENTRLFQRSLAASNSAGVVSAKI